MKFEEIINSNLKIYRIRRKDWSPDSWMTSKNNKFWLQDNKTPWSPLIEDFTADDWEFFIEEKVENSNLTNKTIWKLEPVDINSPRWENTHITGFIIRAATEYEARKLAKENAISSIKNQTDEQWMHSAFVRCEPVNITGDSKVVMVNFSNP